MFRCFIAGEPANGTPGFAGYRWIPQGLLNFGNARNSSETRFGQIETLQGAEFGGTDQFFSEAPPLIYFPVNWFAAGRFGSGGSEEYMIADSTTLKVFGVEESDHSWAFGAIWEQLIGSRASVAFRLNTQGMEPQSATWPYRIPNCIFSACTFPRPRPSRIHVARS